MSERLKKNLKPAIITGGVLMVYLFIRHFTGFSVPCMFHFVTGLQCPGCGMTRMLDAILRLEFAEAYAENPFLFCTFPLIVAELVYEFFLPHTNIKISRINHILLIIYCAALILFGVARNIYRTPDPSLISLVVDTCRKFR